VIPRRPEARRGPPTAAPTGVAVIVLAIVLAVLTAACTPNPPSPTGGASGAPAVVGLESSAPTLPPTPVPDPKHEVYGFVPYWEMDDSIAAHVAKIDLTTLALFSVTHRRSGALATNQTGYQRITGSVGRDIIRAIHDRGERVELVYTSFGETKNRRFYDDPEAQARWIDELVTLTDDIDADGINVDVELLPADLVADYGAFVGRLRTTLRDRIPDGQVSVATQANERGAAMAAAAAAAGADRIFLMGYDYHWAGSDPGASAPIDRLDGDPRDLVWSLDRYAALGVPVERTILGLPLYGMSWPVIGPGVGSPATGRGDDWVPRRNLRVLEDPSFEPTYEPIESVEFYAVPAGPEDVTGDGSDTTSGGTAATSDDPGPSPDQGWDAVYFDSPRSLTPKLALADERGLAGAGFWAIGYERGLPGYRELISTFRAGELQAP
jgi:spore germination protein YaaH